MERSRTYKLLENYFRRTFASDGDFRDYEQILEQTGIDIRSGVSPKDYQTFAQVRDALRTDKSPLMLEVIRGEGVQRIRIGCGAHAKAEDAVSAIRRKSRKMVDLAVTGRIHAVDDEEAFSNQTMARVHSVILSRTTRDAKNEVYSAVSNSFHPTRKFVGLRSLLREPERKVSNSN